MKISPLSVRSRLSFKAINFVKADSCCNDDFALAKKNITDVARTASVDVLSNAGKLLAWANTPNSKYDIDVFVQTGITAMIMAPKIEIDEQVYPDSEKTISKTTQTVSKDEGWRIRVNPTWIEYSELYQENVEPFGEGIDLDQKTSEYLTRSL